MGNSAPPFIGKAKGLALGQMSKLLYFLPRILSIIITLFWMAFVFLSHGLSLEALIESGVWAIILVVAILAWKNQPAGKIGFLVLGLAYLILTKGRENWLTYLLVSGPLFLTGILFLLDKSKGKVPAELFKNPAAKEKEPEEDEGII